MTQTTRVYKTFPGGAIRADVYATPGDGLRPAVVWIHGGALIGGDRSNLPAWQRRRYTDAGYVVVSIDYRLGPEHKLPEIVADVVDALAWVRGDGGTAFGIDPDRVGVVGHSGGGYLALTSGLHAAPPPQAIVSFYGYGEVTDPWYAEPDPFYCRQPAVDEVEARGGLDGPQRFRFYLWCRQNGRWPHEIGGHDPETERDWFAQYEPVRTLDASFPPSLLLHGERDTDVPFAESLLMAEALTRAGVPHTLLRRDTWGHGFDGDPSDPSVGDALDRVIAFLNQNVAERQARA